ncbi:hypothetical protein O181_072098 [Austropuccinia psidii MF-1]|uniref:Uncharacterized protein n=1 Tax=Austropuccinia psidii MF-1 TaxID=1389203 RepID=A0A9Q3F2A9_9BASI|nr:hypothetical protein [Austropuccinia psidii MF-1]
MDTNIICIYSSCRALCVLSGVSPVFAPPQQPMLVMLADKNPKNAHSLCDHSDHGARGDPAQDALVRTPLLSMIMESFPSRNGLPDPKMADENNSGQLALFPPVSICPPPLQGHHPMVTSLLERREVIIRPMKHGNGERTFELGLIVTMGFKHPIKFLFLLSDSFFFTQSY